MKFDMGKIKMYRKTVQFELHNIYHIDYLAKIYIFSHHIYVVVKIIFYLIN